MHRMRLALASACLRFPCCGMCPTSLYVLCPGLCTQVHVRSTANIGMFCQVRPTQLALACSDQYVRVFDRRMLSVGAPGPCAAALHAAVKSSSNKGYHAAGSPKSPEDAARGCRPLLRLAPAHHRLRECLPHAPAEAYMFAAHKCMSCQATSCSHCCFCRRHVMHVKHIQAGRTDASAVCRSEACRPCNAAHNARLIRESWRPPRGIIQRWAADMLMLPKPSWCCLTCV
jgi:hypothetical protein